MKPNRTIGGLYFVIEVLQNDKIGPIKTDLPVLIRPKCNGRKGTLYKYSQKGGL